MNKAKKYIVGLFAFIMIFGAISTAFAVTLNIDIIGITRGYLDIIKGESSTKASQRLDSKKNAVTKDVLAYVNQYKKDITNQLDSYTEEELKKAENDLQGYSTDIKTQLDGSKQQLIDEYKSKIKSDIDAQKAIKDKEIQKAVEDGIKDIFKGR